MSYRALVGFEYLGAMADWVAVDCERQIVSISGDGGFGQFAIELTTAVKCDMKMTHVKMDNSRPGKLSDGMLL